jgi:hypothetical protein
MRARAALFNSVSGPNSHADWRTPYLCGSLDRNSACWPCGARLLDLAWTAWRIGIIAE